VEQFIIHFTNAKTKKVNRLQVEVTYRSTQVIRFKISGKDGRYFCAEKLLFRKNASWKLHDKGFNSDPRDNKVNGQTMTNIIQAIEDHLKGPQRPFVHPKNVGPY
jgi:hypothetical protein